MNPTEARLATLRAMREYVRTSSRGTKVQRDAFDAIDAEIAAIEAEASGGEKVATTGTKFGGPSVSVVAEPYVPKVGDVVKCFGSEYVIASGDDHRGFNGHALDGTECSFRNMAVGVLTYIRHATPSERIAAGIDKARTEAKPMKCPSCHSTTGDRLMAGSINDRYECVSEWHDDVPPPAPPPARPKRVKVTDCRGLPQYTGQIVEVLGWSNDGEPLVKGCHGNFPLPSGQWVPADEPEGCEAWAVFNRFGTVMMYADNEPAARARCDFLNRKHPDDDQQTPYRVVHLIDAELLARSKVKS